MLLQIKGSLDSARSKQRAKQRLWDIVHSRGTDRAMLMCWQNLNAFEPSGANSALARVSVTFEKCKVLQYLIQFTRAA